MLLVQGSLELVGHRAHAPSSELNISGSANHRNWQIAHDPKALMFLKRADKDQTKQQPIRTTTRPQTKAGRTHTDNSDVTEHTDNSDAPEQGREGQKAKRWRPRGNPFPSMEVDAYKVSILKAGAGSQNQGHLSRNSYLLEEEVKTLTSYPEFTTPLSPGFLWSHPGSFPKYIRSQVPSPEQVRLSAAEP